MPIISVIIPVYKVEKYLNQCIDSVINQTFKDIEVILVDDGSPDRCPQICNEYAVKDDRVRVIHKDNGGLSDARNAGISMAKGKYILFLDSDDYWIVGSLEEIANCINDNQDIDLVFLSATKIYENKRNVNCKFECLRKDSVKGKTQLEVLEYLSKVQKFPVSACTKLIKKSLIIDNNIFFQKGLLSEDIDWSTRLLLMAQKFDVCEADFYVYRKQRDESITSSIKAKNVQDLLHIIEKWANICKSQKIDQNLISSLLGLYAYEYTILMGHLFSISRTERKEVYNDVKKLKWLMEYSTDKKTSLVNAVMKIIGFRSSSFLLNTYIRAMSK